MHWIAHVPPSRSAATRSMPVSVLAAAPGHSRHSHTSSKLLGVDRVSRQVRAHQPLEAIAQLLGRRRIDRNAAKTASMGVTLSVWVVAVIGVTGL